MKMAADVRAVVNGMMVEILLSNSLYFLDGTTTTSPGYKLMFLAVIDPLFCQIDIGDMYVFSHLSKYFPFYVGRIGIKFKALCTSINSSNVLRLLSTRDDLRVTDFA
ncbi:MAG: hypothetical protein IPQ18_14785 [Saprospiraceae bacterium]|nr:hypothetical protein [Saprospiraceae bacterium]